MKVVLLRCMYMHENNNRQYNQNEKTKAKSARMPNYSLDAIGDMIDFNLSAPVYYVADFLKPSEKSMQVQNRLLDQPRA